MSKLQTIENIVLGILENNELSRSDDYILICLVCKKLRPEIIDKPFNEVLVFNRDFKMPSWESITRARRKIQSKRPDLVDPNCVRRRRKEEQEYREYAKAE